MTINYLDILIEYRRLTLPSVGNFSIVNYSAKIDREENLIFPPYKKVIYESSSEDLDYSYEIASYLEMKMGLLQSEAVNISQNESLVFLEKKNNSSIIPIPGLGRLFKGKQGEWMFAPDDIEIFREERKGFPVIAYTPINTAPSNPLFNSQENFETNAIEPRLLPAEPIKTKSKRGAFAWWPFSLAAVVLLVSFFLWQQQNSKDASYKVFRMASPESRLNVKPLDNDRLYPENGEDLDGTVIDSSRFFEGEEAEDDLEEMRESPDDSSSEEIITEEYSTNEEDKPNTNIKIAEIPGNNPALGPEDCLVIVGAFANPENVEKMKEKLLEYGAKIITDTDIKLTRVGVMIPCSSEDLPQLLQKLRAEINTGTWVMRKK